MLFLMKASLLASALSFGGIAFASLHVRLGLGAFFRPTLGLGALFGTPEVDAGGGMVAELSQVAFLTRIVLAGPEINVSIGSFKADGSDESTSFTTVAGGFAVGVGYVF